MTFAITFDGSATRDDALRLAFIRGFYCGLGSADKSAADIGTAADRFDAWLQRERLTIERPKVDNPTS